MFLEEWGRLWTGALFYKSLRMAFINLYQLIRRANPIYMNTLHHIQGKCIIMLLLTFLHKPHVPEVAHTGILMCGYSWRFIFKTIQTEYLQHISSLFCINTFRGFEGVKGYGRM